MTEEHWLMLFSRNLIGLMEQTRTTQKDLSEATGLDQSTISRYMNGTRTPSIKAIINISEFFGEDIDDLIYFGDRID